MMSTLKTHNIEALEDQLANAQNERGIKTKEKEKHRR